MPFIKIYKFLGYYLIIIATYSFLTSQIISGIIAAVAALFLFFLIYYTAKGPAKDVIIALRNLYAFAGDQNNLPQMATIKKYFRRFPGNTELSIALVNNDTVTYLGIKKHKGAIHIIRNENSVFEIGSITKVFTSILLSKYIHQGLVKLDDPIKNHLDFTLKQSSLNGKEVTLENLANHTSGLPRLDPGMAFILYRFIHISNPYKDYDESKLKSYLQKRMRLRSIPGTKYAYSNLGIGLLGYILCRKTKKTYEQLLQENIFMPYGMSSSTTDLNKIKTGLVKGLTVLGTEAQNWIKTDATAGAGAIKSTVCDMARFIQANLSSDPVLELPMKKTFSINRQQDIGLAWHMQHQPKTVYVHNGGTGGYKSCLAIDKENKKGVVVLSNVSAYHISSADIDTICVSLLFSM